MLEVGTAGTLVVSDGTTEPVVANEPDAEVLVVMKEPSELVLVVEGSALLLVGRAGQDSWNRAVTLTDTTVPVNELK